MCTARDGSDSQARRALEELYETYWHPLYAFVRRQGHDCDAASDLTQAFFTELLEKDFLKSAGPSGGRFRSFLLVSLKHFLSHERERDHALKRGGGVRTISLDARSAEGRFDGIAAAGLSPEEVFERQWALTVLERALERLRKESSDLGSEDRFERLKGYLTGDARRTPYQKVALELGMSEGAVRGAVHRLRKRFGRMLRAEITDTVADPAEADDEIRHLLAVIRPWEAGRSRQ